jgi:hypothetical protein
MDATMRKTIHEWLESHENGKAMANRKKRRRKPPGRKPQGSDTAAKETLQVKSRRKAK